MKITFEVITPNVFKEHSTTIEQRLQEYKLEVLRTFKSYLIKVLKERRSALLSNFLRHTEDVIFDNGEYAEYVRKDKTHGLFIKNEFEAMAYGIGLLQNEEFEGFLRCKMLSEQCILGIPFTEKPEDMSGKPKFSDLMRVLTMQ